MQWLFLFLLSLLSSWEMNNMSVWKACLRIFQLLPVSSLPTWYISNRFWAFHDGVFSTCSYAFSCTDWILLSHYENTIWINVNGLHCICFYGWRFSLPAWLSRTTTKRRKVVLPPNNLPIKKTKSKSLKDKIVSRILADSDKTKFFPLWNDLFLSRHLRCSDYMLWRLLLKNLI